MGNGDGGRALADFGGFGDAARERRGEGVGEDVECRIAGSSEVFLGLGDADDGVDGED